MPLSPQPSLVLIVSDWAKLADFSDFGGKKWRDELSGTETARSGSPGGVPLCGCLIPAMVGQAGQERECRVDRADVDVLLREGDLDVRFGELLLDRLVQLRDGLQPHVEGR